VKDLKRALTRIWTFLVYGGSTHLRTYEKLLLDSILIALDSSDAAAIRAQLASLDHIKRQHNDRMVTFHFFEADRLPRISNRDGEHRLATYQLSGEAIKATVVLFSHRGLLSSLEFSKTPRALEGKHVAMESAKAKGRAFSLPQTIDRSEHGSDGEDSSGRSK